MKHTHPSLEHIMYISIPEDWHHTIEGFRIDPSILLPVESSQEQDWSISELSWEAIISAMLKILAYQPDHQDIDYFRNFILSVKPDLPDELSETGVIKARNRDMAIAEEIFRALTNLQPDNALSQMNLSLICEQRAQAFSEIENTDLQKEYLDAAFAEYHKLFQMDDIPVIAHLNAGFFYARHNEFDRALHHLQVYINEGEDEELIEKANRLRQTIETQNLQDTKFKEAYDFIAMGQEERGLERVEEFIRDNPKVWNAWFLLGWGLRRLGRYQDAAVAFEKTSELHPGQADTQNELAICYMELDRYQDARHALETALKAEPQNTKVISNFGVLALKMEDYDQARGFFETVLDYDPEDPIALKYLEHLRSRE